MNFDVNLDQHYSTDFPMLAALTGFDISTNILTQGTFNEKYWKMKFIKVALCEDGNGQIMDCIDVMQSYEEQDSNELPSTGTEGGNGDEDNTDTVTTDPETNSVDDAGNDDSGTGDQD